VPGGVDWSYEEIRWWRHWLLGEDTGIMEEPMFRAFMPYQTARQAHPKPIPGRWIAEQEWPPANITIRKYWLNSAGLEQEAKAVDERVYCPVSPVGLTKPEWLNKLPIDQNADDLHSLVFDSRPLKEDFEILGYPMINLRISANKPVASVAVRLAEVTPAEESWLVNYVIRNLTHRDTHTHPALLVPDRFYDVSMPMYMIAHRFEKGHRIRVTISDALWPLTCPAPERASLKIVVGVSSLELPVRPLESQSQDLPMQQYTGKNARTPQEIQPIEPDDQGRYVYEHHQPQVCHTDPEIGTTMTNESTEVSRIKFGSNMTCSWRHDVRLGWQRKDWHCEIEAKCKLIASPRSFYISETLKAYQDSRLIFEHNYREKVKRDLL
jgi:predicted acyl esterase